MLASCPGLLAGIPRGAPRPSLGVLLFAIVLLLMVIGLNTFWEIRKGPPEP